MMAAARADGPRRRPVAGRACTVAGSLAAEAAAGYWHPGLGAVLAVADVVVPASIGLILLIAILCGSAETCERAFRLLRWIAGRAEPPAPPPVAGKRSRSSKTSTVGCLSGDVDSARDQVVARLRRATTTSGSAP
jgi:hypothetical protein